MKEANAHYRKEIAELRAQICKVYGTLKKTDSMVSTISSEDHEMAQKVENEKLEESKKRLMVNEEEQEKERQAISEHIVYLKHVQHELYDQNQKLIVEWESLETTNTRLLQSVEKVDPEIQELSNKKEKLRKENEIHKE